MALERICWHSVPTRVSRPLFSECIFKFPFVAIVVSFIVEAKTTLARLRRVSGYGGPYHQTPNSVGQSMQAAALGDEESGDCFLADDGFASAMLEIFRE